VTGGIGEAPAEGMGYAVVGCFASPRIIFLVHSLCLMHPTRHEVTHTAQNAQAHKINTDEYNTIIQTGCRQFELELINTSSSNTL
tara:strand:- start:254 stop:508 length:255 start_codon:yes stop_codon:yes gene_type:complete